MIKNIDISKWLRTEALNYTNAFANKYNKAQLSELEHVYEAITGKIPARGCVDCRVKQLHMVHNYIMFHEIHPDGEVGVKSIPKPINTTMKLIMVSKPEGVTETFESSDNIDYTKYKLKELRSLFPDIKATSTFKFIQQIPK